MIALACDHGALELKLAVKRHLEEKGIACQDFGTDTADSCDYPDFGAAAARAVASGACEKGIVLCTDGHRHPASRPIRSRESAARCCRT